jgi:hypothetical protein
LVFLNLIAFSVLFIPLEQLFPNGRNSRY